MASVSKRKWTYKGVEKTAWIVRYVDTDGTRRQDTFERKKEADARRLQIETEMAQGTHVATAATCTVADLGALYLRDLERRAKIKDRMTYTSLSNYRNFIDRHIVVKFGAVRLTRLTSDMIQDWLNDACLEYKRPTVARMRQTFKALIDYGLQRKLVGRNVIIDGKVRVPEMERTRTAIPSLSDIAIVLRSLMQRSHREREQCHLNRRIAIGVALFSSLRRGEVAGLQWENVDFATGRIMVRHSRSMLDGLKTPKTFAGIRDNPLPAHVLDALREAHRLRGYPETGYVLLSQRGKPFWPQEIWNLWNHMARSCGLVKEDGTPKFSFHAFRHAAASLMIGQGVTPLHVKTFMGHASVQTTMNVYGHLFPEDERTALAVTAIADRLLIGATPPHKTINHCDS